MTEEYNLHRQDNETIFQYFHRLLFDRLVYHTIDTDYTVLCELLYGKKYCYRSALDRLYSSLQTITMIETDAQDNQTELDFINYKETLQVLQAKTLQFQKEKKQFYDQRREYNKLLAIESRQDHLYEQLINAANTLNETVGILNTPDTNLEFSDTEGILVLCDWHYGMIADNIFNTYNTDICKQRVETTINLAISKIQLQHCKKLHIVILGDLIHGAIRTSARVASEELVVDQIIQVSEILAQTILQLSKYVETVDVYMTYGNHARVVQIKADSIHKDNMERLIPWWLNQRLQSAKNVTLQDTSKNEFIFLTACGHEICATHGDLDSVKNTSTLFPALFQKTYQKNIEYILLADKHHRESFDSIGIPSVICGALCGTDEYANNKRLYSRPEQLLLFVTKKHGIDGEYHLHP